MSPHTFTVYTAGTGYDYHDSTWRIDERGMLWIYDDEGKILEVYAAGAWASIQVGTYTEV